MGDERCETCGLFSRKWIEFMRGVAQSGGRLEGHCRCAETRQAEFDDLRAKLKVAERALERIRDYDDPTGDAAWHDKVRQGIAREALLRSSDRGSVGTEGEP